MQVYHYIDIIMQCMHANMHIHAHNYSHACIHAQMTGDLSLQQGRREMGRCEGKKQVKDASTD